MLGLVEDIAFVGLSVIIPVLLFLWDFGIES